MSESTSDLSNRTNLGLQVDADRLRAAGPKGLADALAGQLRQAIRSGRLPAGTSLPSSRSLALDLGVSRGVVVRTYERLVAEGYLLARTGRGTEVAEIHAADVTSGASPGRPLVPANPGVPALGWFPRTEWRRAMTTALGELPDADLGYGDPRGHPRLRRALSAYLGRTRAVIAPVDRIVVTAGFAQGARLVAEALARHGVTAIGVEDPGSKGVTQTLTGGGLEVRPVPVDEDGLEVERLAATDLRAVAVTPAHQFPTGAVLGPSRRTALLEWAASRGAVVLEDDYDAEYRYDRSAVGALQGLAPDQVVYGGSVSKTLAPGLRLGWLVAPERLLPALVEARYWADIASPVIDQVALAAFIEAGALDRHVRRTASRYAKARRALRSAVDRHLPGWHLTGIAAGLHAVLVPPATVSERVVEAMARAAADTLHVVALSAYAHGSDPRRGLVVGYGASTPDRVERGVRAIANRQDALLATGRPLGAARN